MNRSAEMLRRDQGEILRAYRGEKAQTGEVAVLPRPGAPGVVVPYGRVSEVVATDPAYGPHLRVVRQVWSGTPPQISDGEAAPIRCYPSPNRTVSYYAVGDYVRIAAMRGAMVAERLG